MLRRAIRRARLHLPAGSVGPEDADRPVVHGPEGPGGPDVAHTSLAFDAEADARLRRTEEDVAGVDELLRALRRETDASARPRTIERVGDEAQRAADAWGRLQRLYGLFQAMEGDGDGEDREDGARPRRTRDQGLRSLFKDERTPAGVMLRDLHALPSAAPEGFTADAFLSVGDALYAEMVEASAAQQQRRAALEQLGDALYVDAVAVPVVPVSAC